MMTEIDNYAMLLEYGVDVTKAMYRVVQPG